MICVRCKKRPAMVFVSSKNEAEEDVRGYCMKCARELGIRPINDIIDKMKIDGDELDEIQDRLCEILRDDEEDEEDISEDNRSRLFPFVQNMLGETFGCNDNDDSNSGAEKSKNERERIFKRKKKRNLDLYCYNLTSKAKKGELDLIIGREKEISRVVQILSRRTKNNPCLIGEPGVGKTAIAEGLAIKISEGDVPSRLKNKEIYLLDLTALVAGTQFRGQFEARIKGLIEEVKKAGNVILFIDEVHNISSAGDADGAMNAANILKPALSRGEIQVIGATTFDEYRKYIEKDTALERRFQPVKIEEPSVEDTVKLLKGIKIYYENYHSVMIPDELLMKMVILSERYITDRFLPDKAIDIMDESCAHAAIRNKDLDEYNDIEVDVAEKKKREDDLALQSEEIDYEKLAELRCEISRLESRKEELYSKIKDYKVTSEDIASVIELWTGIPASKIKENELKKLANMEEVLSEKIIGQDEGVKAVAAAIKRNRVAISPRRRPASFIFVGPTGVGKTELVKVLSEQLFDTPDTLIRLDMSEFMEKHAVSRLIGSPPGYVGYEESGQLTEKVRRKPYSVLLFDEIEKAHPDVLNILLQVMDEGSVTDSHGHKVNFENTVIVMTSNAGSDKSDSPLGFGKSEYDINKEKVMKALSDFLRPEFLSRVDEIVIFKRLTEEEYVKVAKLMLDEYIESLKERNIELLIDEEVYKWLAKKSIDGKSGARDIRNLIRRDIEDRFANLFIDNIDREIKKIKISINDDNASCEIID